MCLVFWLLLLLGHQGALVTFASKANYSANDCKNCDNRLIGTSSSSMSENFTMTQPPSQDSRHLIQPGSFSFPSSSSSSSSSSFSSSSTSFYKPVKKRLTKKSCQILRTDIMMMDGSEIEEVHCIFHGGGDEDNIAFVVEGISEKQKKRNKDAFLSGESYLEISSANSIVCEKTKDMNDEDGQETLDTEKFSIYEGTIDDIKGEEVTNHVPCEEKLVLDSTSRVFLFKRKKKKKKNRKKRNLNNNTEDRRNLDIKRSGTRKVLVLRGRGLDNQLEQKSAELSDDIFGIDGDPVNLVSQFGQCSNGNFDIVMATGSNIQNGVADIFVDMNIQNGDRIAIMNAMTRVAEASLTSFPDAYDHVIYCIPPGTGNWLAYGYYNNFRSVYNGISCSAPSALMHEFGHNLDLQHSGYDGNKYGDTSGVMGYSYRWDDTPQMCYNAAHSWFLGWYSDRHLNVDPFTAPGYFKLAGIVDYANGQTESGQHVVIARIVQSTSNFDLYLLYNKAEGFNIGTRKFINEVTIVQGADEEKTTCLTSLSEGEVYSIPAFNGGVHNLVVEVCEIRDGVPDFARVLVYLDGYDGSRVSCSDPPPESVEPSPTLTPTASPTSTPTASPTSTPTASPTSTPTASPTLTPTTIPTLPPTTSPTVGPTSSPTAKLTATPTVRPSSTPSALPTTLPTALPTIPKVTTIKLPVASTSKPTANPSSVPSQPPTTTKPTTTKPTYTPTTTKPTQSPTAKPTQSPTAKPTAKPTYTPTVKPTQSPTVKPTQSPTTSKPTTQSPTWNPTSEPSKNPTKSPSLRPIASPKIKMCGEVNDDCSIDKNWCCDGHKCEKTSGGGQKKKVCVVDSKRKKNKRN